MAKRGAEAVVDLTLDSDDEKPLVPPAKRSAVDPPRRHGSSPTKTVVVEGTPGETAC